MMMVIASCLDSVKDTCSFMRRAQHFVSRSVVFTRACSIYHIDLTCVVEMLIAEMHFLCSLIHNVDDCIAPLNP